MGTSFIRGFSVIGFLLLFLGRAEAEAPSEDNSPSRRQLALQLSFGPVTEAEFKEIEESVGCDACAFTLVQDFAQKALALIKRRNN